MGERREMAMTDSRVTREAGEGRKSGYTLNIYGAGRYSLEDALSCCELRSKRADKVPPEIVQPSPEWLAMAESTLNPGAAKEGL